MENLEKSTSCGADHGGLAVSGDQEESMEEVKVKTEKAKTSVVVDGYGKYGGFHK